MAEFTKGELFIDLHGRSQKTNEIHIGPLGYIDEIFAAKLPKGNEAEQWANALELLRRWNSQPDLYAACKKIANLEKECCPRCEGNGRLWADGKCHLPTAQVDTVLCGNCGGSGNILPDDAQEIAKAALAKADKLKGDNDANHRS